MVVSSLKEGETPTAMPLSGGPYQSTDLCVILGFKSVAPVLLMIVEARTDTDDIRLTLRHFIGNFLNSDLIRRGEMASTTSADGSMTLIMDSIRPPSAAGSPA